MRTLLPEDSQEEDVILILCAFNYSGRSLDRADQNRFRRIHLKIHRGSASQMTARQHVVISNSAPLFRPLPQLQLGRRGTIAS